MAREMRDSGVAWLGVIPVNWKFDRVKHYYTTHKFVVGESADKYERLALTLNGVIKRPKEDRTGLQPDAFNGYQVLKRGELVFKLIDLENVSTSRVGFSPYTGIVSPAYIVLKPNRTVNPRFGYYYFISLWQREIFNHLGDDGVRSSLNANDLLNLPYLFPLLDDQNQIVVYLDRKCSEIDAVLKKTRDSIEEYKKLKQAIITQAVTKGIRGDRPMKESGIEWIRSIPVEWEVVPAKRLFRNSDERKHPDDEQLTASQKYGVISQQQYMEKEDTRIVLASQGIENWKHVEPYNFIISLRSFQGGLEMSEVSGCITWHYIVLKPLRPIHSFYFKWLFKSELYIKALQRTCNFIRDGQDIRYSNFVQVPLFIPPLEEQKEIADFLNIQCAEIDALIKKKVQFLAELEAYKKSLIYEYVTGKKEMPLAQLQSCISFIDARVLLMCRIIELLKPKGRIHLMKALYTVDCMLNLNSTTQYQRQKHGPYDARIEEYEKVLMKNGWVDIKAGSPVEYTQTETFEAYREKYQSYYGHIDDDIQRLCSFLQPMKTSKAERVATLLAAWNDFILQGIKPTDSQLVQEVRSNWTPNKAHSSKSTWLGTLVEMKAYKIIPSGYGKCTVHMK